MDHLSVPWSSERMRGENPSRSPSPHSGLGLPHIPVCAMRVTFFRAVRNPWTGNRKVRVMVKDCPLLKTRCRELMASVWCSSLFSAACKSQLLIPRAVWGKGKSWVRGECNNANIKGSFQEWGSVSLSAVWPQQAALLNSGFLLRRIPCRVIGREWSYTCTHSCVCIHFTLAQCPTLIKTHEMLIVSGSESKQWIKSRILHTLHTPPFFKTGRARCIPGWSWTCCVAEVDLEPLILLHPSSKCWDYKRVFYAVLG